MGGAVKRLAELEKLPAQVKEIQTEHPKRWGITVTQAEVRQAQVTKSTDSATREYVERRLATVTQSQFSATEWVGRYGKKTADVVDNIVPNLEKNDSVFAGGISGVATDTDRRLTQLERTSTTGDPGVIRVETQLKDVKLELEKLKISDTKINTDLKDLTTKVKDQEKVNQSAIPKLDQILGILPLIPARAAAAIRPDIPTIPQIETASATGTCRTLQPGGCSKSSRNQNINQ